MSLRSATDTLSTATDALSFAQSIIGELVNAHHCNPIITGPWLDSTGIGQANFSEGTKVDPTCNFDTTRAFCALMHAAQALACLTHCIALRGELMMNEFSKDCEHMWYRGFYVLLPVAARQAAAAIRTVDPALGRMHHGEV